LIKKVFDANREKQKKLIRINNTYIGYPLFFFVFFGSLKNMELRQNLLRKVAGLLSDILMFPVVSAYIIILAEDERPETETEWRDLKCNETAIEHLLSQKKCKCNAVYIIYACNANSQKISLD